MVIERKRCYFFRRSCSVSNLDGEEGLHLKGGGIEMYVQYNLEGGGKVREQQCSQFDYHQNIRPLFCPV